jgi:uncharacterized cupredoxin-like copper-binding protein
MPLPSAAGPRRRAHLLIPLAAIAVLVLGACASGSTAGWTYAPAVATPTAAAGSPGASGSPGESVAPSASVAPSTASSAAPSGGSSSPGASGGTGQTIELEETADLHITQNGSPVQSIAVTPGETVTFKITNSAGFSHDFFIGPPDQLSGNNTAGLPGIPEFSSGTQEFTYTVPADVSNLEFGCTLPGHYPSMHGTLTAK